MDRSGMQLSPSRRSFLRTSTFLLGGAAIASALSEKLFAQDDAARIAELNKMLSGVIQVTKLSGNVSMLTGSGGNIGILTGRDGKLIVDSGVSTAAAGVLQALSQVDEKPLKYLVNTHWHFDHTGGNVAFHDAGAAILAHKNTRERLSHPQYVELLKVHVPVAAAAALPTRTLTDAFTLYHDDEEVALQSVKPAHTDTDLFVYFKQADVIHAGDLFFNGMYPLIDYSSGGNINGTVDAMATILAVARDSTKIIPGHGPLASKSDLATAHDVLAKVRDRVAAARQAGKGLPEVVAAKPSAEFDEKWGKGIIAPDTLVTVIYNTL
jgi:cyclase